MVEVLEASKLGGVEFLEGERKKSLEVDLKRSFRRFRKLKSNPGSKLSINITPASGDVILEDLESPDEVNAGLTGTVFTMGFTAATSDLTSFQMMPEPPPKPSSAPVSSMPRGRRLESGKSGRKVRRRKKPTSVKQFLEDLRLNKLLPLFEAEEVDLRSLEELDERDLKEMGVKSSRDRRAICEAIFKMRKNGTK